MIYFFFCFLGCLISVLYVITLIRMKSLGVLLVGLSFLGIWLFGIYGFPYLPGMGEREITEILPMRVVLFAIIPAWILPVYQRFFGMVAFLSGLAFPLSLVIFYGCSSEKMGLLRVEVLPVVARPIDEKLLPGVYFTESHPSSTIDLHSDGTCTAIHLSDSWKFPQSSHVDYETFSGRWHLQDYGVEHGQTITCVVIAPNPLSLGGLNSSPAFIDFEITTQPGHKPYVLALQNEVLDLKYIAIFVKK